MASKGFLLNIHLTAGFSSITIPKYTPIMVIVEIISSMSKYINHSSSAFFKFLLMILTATFIMFFSSSSILPQSLNTFLFSKWRARN